MEIYIICAITLAFFGSFYLLVRCRIERKSILDSLYDGVILLDRKGRILSSNSTAKKMLQIPKELRYFSRLKQVEDHPLFEICQSVLACCLKQRKRKSDIFQAETPHFKSYEISAIPVKMGRVMLIINDRSATDRMQMMGKNFVANASHELRTPITIIRGFAEMLQEASEVSADMVEGVIEKILRNCTRMSTLVKNLITLADLDNKKLKEKQPVDLISLLDMCHYTLLMVHPEANIELLHNVGVAEVEADPDMLELAFSNLLENAVKYSDAPVQITTTIALKEGIISISIKDKGRGIPSEDLPHIFERFYTVDKAHSRKLGGAGLGLSIVSKIMALHGFALHAESTYGEGATFVITAPVFCTQEFAH